jgi:predicted ATP-dependent serine protease
MAKKTTIFVCENCGHEAAKWMGRCPRCMNWDTMREFTPAAATSAHEKQKPVLVSDEDISEERVTLGIGEMDRVLGGGLTIGSAILLGGDPGIGKTTLCFEIASKMVGLGLKVLYVSGEESLKQLASRKKRLQLDGPFPSSLPISLMISLKLHRPRNIISLSSIPFNLLTTQKSPHSPAASVRLKTSLHGSPWN